MVWKTINKILDMPMNPKRTLYKVDVKYPWMTQTIQIP